MWTKLKEYCWKAVAVNANLKAVYPNNVLLFIFTKAFSNFYKPIIRGFITQPSLTVKEKFKMLGKHEVKVKKETEQVHAAFWYHHFKHHIQRRIGSDTSMFDTAINYYIYGGNHFAKDCDFANEIKEYSKKLCKE